MSQWDGRTHFVYRMYAVDGQLLYVGCTSNPRRRQRQHYHERRPIHQATAHCRLSGPYVEIVAFAKERAAIAAEHPLGNAEGSYWNAAEIARLATERIEASA
jgi:predicted GIY-YIG superfamily endonuclease